ncbi:MAG: dual specificity protein phosphatase family protein [Candidatus Korobacteraceae bacterium]|jgi:hypothetical protein
MIEVHPGLFVGPQEEYESLVRHERGWAVVHACKEPYHREAVGYISAKPPERHPEYFVARRGTRLCLNLLDAPDPADISAEVMDAAVAFIHEHLMAGGRVFLHCQMGMSRSPSIAMLYLGTHTDRLPTDSFDVALIQFSEVYPPFSPRPGVSGFLRERWASGVSSR